MTTVIAPENPPAKQYVRLPIWLVLVMALGGMTSVMALVIGVGFYFFGFTGTRELVQDRDFDASRFAGMLERLLRDPDKRLAMANAARTLAKPDAADVIAQRCMEVAA